MRWTIGKKLTSVFALTLIILGFMGGLSIYKLYKFNQKVDELVNDWRPRLEAILQIDTALQRVYAYDRSLFSTMDAQQKAAIIGQIDEQFAVIEEKLAAYEATMAEGEEEDRKNFEGLKSAVEAYKQFNPTMVSFGKKMDLSQSVSAEDLRQLEEAKKKEDELFADRSTYTNAMIAYNRDGTTRASQESESLYQTGIRDNAILLVASILEFLVVAIWLTRSLRGPILRIVKNVREVANGNLQVEPIAVKNRDELKDLSDSVNEMTSNLQQVIGQVKTTSKQVAFTAEQLMASSEQTSQATEQIAVTVQEVATGTDRQVESVERSSASMDSLSAGIQQIAGNVKGVSETVVQVSRVAGEGNQSVQAAVRQMSAIHDTMRQLSGVVDGLDNHSEAIGQIVEVITGIAEQTNLLALNAAIEAARAGDKGRGFAVVADEVRKLAEQSSQSAGQIAQLIGTIQADTRLAVESMETGTREVQAGITVVHHAGETFGQIQSSIAEVSGQIQSVSAAAQDMSAFTLQVVEAIGQIADVTQTTADGTQSVSAAAEEQLAAMQEIAASATTLSEMAEVLQGMIGRFRV